VRSHHSTYVALATLVSLLLLAVFPAIVWAQAGSAPGVPVAAPVENPGLSLSDDVYTMALLILAGILVLGLGVACLELWDLQRKRDDEAVQLQAQIGDALLRDRRLARFPVAPTVHIPMRRRATATIELHGQVPTTELRQSVLRVAEQEATRILQAYRIQDHITVEATVGAQAA
jgi:hypothetical protein